MVEMIRKILFVTLAVTAVAVRTSAQEVTARIAGLEQNETYMEMLRAEATLQIREDSVTTAIGRVRQLLREDPSQRATYSKEILQGEEELFDIRAERSRLTDKINTIEQDWVLSNLNVETQAPSTTEAEHVTHTYKQYANLVRNPLFREKLTSEDYRHLQQVQENERSVFEMARSCMDNYQSIEEIKIAYDTISVEQNATTLYERYRALQSLNRTLCDSLQRVWSDIYDHKNYAYAYVLDRLGREDLLAQAEEQTTATRQQMADNRGNYYADELSDYVVAKQSLLAYETQLAEALRLPLAQDSLTQAKATLNKIDYRLPKLYIEQRTFIDYEEIGFGSSARYNSSNPIPEAKVYERGTIYRIELGAYANRTNGGSLFKGAYPLCYEKVNGKYTYYAGAFRTLDEAQAAQAMLSRKGFRRPEIVVWNDGVRSNFDADESEESPVRFRVEIAGDDVVWSAALREAVQEIAGECEISLAGKTYLVGPLSDKAVAERIKERVLQEDDKFEVKITEITE